MEKNTAIFHGFVEHRLGKLVSTDFFIFSAVGTYLFYTYYTILIPISITISFLVLNY